VDLARTTDSALVARARAGAAGAAEELFRRHWPGAWRRAFAVTGRRAAADDVAQDAIVHALSRLDDLGDGDRFAAWLDRIVTRRAIDLLRRERRLVEIAAAGEPVVEWAGGMDEAGLRPAVAALDPDRRAVVVMRYWLDLTPPEIAAALDLPLGTVHSRLARALSDLRAALAEASRA
jgi:RNA polymerase sigma-70 factor (ECF subfamily)